MPRNMVGVVRLQMWDEQVVARVADVLGHTATEDGTGLTGKRIGELLAAVRIPDVVPGITKRDRLREALLARQRQDRAANCVSGVVRGHCA